MSELFNRNLLEPCTFEQVEIDIFIRDNSCGICGHSLFAKHAPDRKYTAHCPEHGVVLDHMHTSKHNAEKAKDNIRAGKSELRQPKNDRPASEIITELGY